ncbi:MAG: carnitine dehydratase [Acidobacteria bacterium]|nr:MAG: carnitine dehydratase [Acidobacteriota bacterium]
MSGGALAGLRVLDLTRYIPGPYATMMLADLGADVVKVEAPGGDPTRALPPAVGEESAAHAALNRGKRSVVVDIRTADGAAVVRQLALGMDVLVESFRPGVLARQGLGPEALLEANPRLVYCSLTGYGQDGPYRDRAGHDIDYAALGGFLGSNRDPDGRPVIPTTQVADMTAGLLTAFGVLAALHARERTGHGQHVDVSLLRAALALMSLPLARSPGGPADELTGAYPCYTVYRCRDGGALAVGALEAKFWERLCQALGKPELAGRQWATGDTRVQTRAALAALFASRDRDDWVSALAPQDVCVEPVLALDEVAAHPAAARALMDAPVGRARLRTVAPPVRFSRTPAEPPLRAPALGEHTDEVLGQAGFTRADLERLRREGVLA